MERQEKESSALDLKKEAVILDRKQPPYMCWKRTEYSFCCSSLLLFAFKPLLR